jgi:hypothetical protein
MPGITQPLENHVRVHCATTRNLRHRNARRRRVSADRPLLFAPPKPLRPTCHSLLRSVRYPKRTLSITPYQRQSSQAGRLLVGRTNARKTWGGQSVFAVSAKRERAIRGSASASAALPRRRGSCPANGLSGSSQTRQIRSGRWISWLTGQASQLLNAADIAAPEGLGIEVDAS